MRCVMLLVLAIVMAGVRVEAHPAPFSYLDLRLAERDPRSGVADGVRGTLVLHVLDVAHDLGIAPEDRLLDPAEARAVLPRVAALLRDRLTIVGDGRTLVPVWDGIEPLSERHAVRLQFHLAEAASGANPDVSPASGAASVAQAAAAGATAFSPAAVTVRAHLFPYDPSHQTFLNVYETGVLAQQAILDARHQERGHYTGSIRGRFAVFATFVPAGVHHILIGPDHVLFLVGLLLLGGGPWPLVRIVTAFTIGHSLTLSLAALDLVTPSSRLVEPLIALSIVFVGVDNLLVRREGGRDVRLWVALVFGFVHGFGFAAVLRELGLPREALAWSLFGFNLGVEIGQLAIVGVIASLLAGVRRYSVVLGQRVAVAGSCVVIAAGAYWFIERVFFTGGV